eukprot:scaffold203_cov386-Prasinococcus_capsulatus_cf.AAC.28
MGRTAVSQPPTPRRCVTRVRALGPRPQASDVRTPAAKQPRPSWSAHEMPQRRVPHSLLVHGRRLGPRGAGCRNPSPPHTRYGGASS